jgi:hypothetical protein
MGPTLASQSVSVRANAASNFKVTADQLANLDFADKSTKQGSILALNTAAMLLIFLFVSVRIAVRCLMTRRFFVDDGKWLYSVVSLASVGLSY